MLTVEPSTIGSRSRCTPSRETSGPACAAFAGDLVDLVEEHDAGLFGAAHGLALDLIHVEQLLRLFVLEQAARVDHAHFPALWLAAEARDVAQHLLELDLHVLETLATEHGYERAGRLLHVELDLLVVELSGTEPGAQLGGIGGRNVRRRHSAL